MSAMSMVYFKFMKWLSNEGKMKLIYLLMIAGFTGAASAQPTIEIHEGRLGELKLGPVVEQALKKFNPNFQVYNSSDFIQSLQDVYVAPTREQLAANKNKTNCDEMIPPADKSLPQAVVGDFNGDKIDDVVLLGHDQKSHYVLGVLSSGKTYEVSIIERSEYVPPTQSTFPPKEAGEPEPQDVERGLTESLTLVESEAEARKSEYIKKCVSPDVKRFKNDAVLVSEYMSPANRLYYVKGKKFVEYKP